MRVLICGGGVIGAAIAYFLGRHGVEAVVIERTSIACAASGKAGGFLARDWCDGSALGPLARRSFDLHAELAAKLSVDYGYRRLDTLAVVANAGWGGQSPKPHWLAKSAQVHGRLGSTETTAQVHPALFTRALMDAAAGLGARHQIGCITGLHLSRDDSAVLGVQIGGDTIEGDAVVIAMGPWSVLACSWLPLPPVYGLKGHSIVLRPETPASPHALFVEYQGDDGADHAPEVFPRPDGTTYVCGLPGHEDLPLDPADIVEDPSATARLRAITSAFAPSLARGEIVAAQACYRPVTTDGLPVLGPVPGVDNAYVATGHSCWGILNAPASGEALAERIVDGRSTTVDLRPFDPARLASYRPERPAAV